MALILLARTPSLTASQPMLTVATVALLFGALFSTLDTYGFPSEYLMILGTALFGLGSTILFLGWVELFSSLSLQSFCIGIAGSMIVGSALFFVVIVFNHFYAPIWGIQLALFSIVSLIMLGHGLRVTRSPKREIASEPTKLFPVPLTMLFAVMTYSVAFGFMISVVTAVQGSLSSPILLGLSVGACMLVVSALMFAILARQRPSGKFLAFSFRAIQLLVMLGYLLLPITGFRGPFPYLLVLTGYALVFVSVLVMFAIGIRGSHAPVRALASGLLSTDIGIIVGLLLFQVLKSQTNLLVTTHLAWLPLLAVVVLILVTPLLSGEKMKSPWILNGKGPQASDSEADELAQTCRLLAEWNNLTPRQQETLVLLAQGKRADEIADAFNLSIGTVRTHINQVYSKLGVHSQKELMKVVRASEPRGKSTA
ncbi:MAG: helix-turn-helix transcriptional regulator [Coriobacteriia bacterium]